MVDVTADLNTNATVGILARLDDPHAMAVFGVFYQIWVGLRVLVDLEKLQEFSVILAFFDMKG